MSEVPDQVETSLSAIIKRIRGFNRARDWETFHDPKTLSMALAAEAGELLELFQWLTPAQAAAIVSEPDKFAQVQDEVADVAVYLLTLTDRLGIDLLAAVAAKIDRNEHRYPVENSRGNATKYDEFD